MRPSGRHTSSPCTPDAQVGRQLAIGQIITLLSEQSDEFVVLFADELRQQLTPQPQFHLLGEAHDTQPPPAATRHHGIVRPA